MKNLLLLCAVCFTSFSLSAQDLIELVGGEEISGWVLEVGYEIRYQRADFPDGPVYVLERPEVLMITYANGREEIINLEAAQQDGSFAVRQSYLKMRGNKYYEGFRLIGEEEFMQKLQVNPAMYDDFKKGRSLQRTGYVLAGGGLALGLVGAAATRRRNYDNFNSFQTTGTLQEPRFGIVWMGMGVGLVGVGIVLAGTQKISRVLDNYNIQVGQTGSLGPALNEEGVGFILKF